MGLKKVLIILYYWPPAGGPGIQRWLKFVKYLPEFGIKPIVYYPENPNYPITDSSLVKEIPDVTLIKHPINEPYRFLNHLSKRSTKQMSTGLIPEMKKQNFFEKLMLYVRGNFFIPDARVLWVKPSVVFLESYIKKHAIKTIITTGPPHSLHLIGKRLKEKLNLEWLADFRDPWTTIYYHKALKLNTRSKRKHIQLEHKVLNCADQIVVTSRCTKDEFSKKTKTPITLITNGYENIPVKYTCLDKTFSISHIGTLLSKRNPEILWQVLSEIINEHKNFAQSFQLNLIGVVSDSVIQSIETYGLKSFVIFKGYLSHDKALIYQQKSQLLLLIEINSKDTKAIIPGKLFEYIAAQRPIVAIGPMDSDIEYIITQTQTGKFFNYNQKKELKAQIIAYFDAFKDGNLGVNAKNINQYSRKSLTQKLVNVLDSMAYANPK